MRGIAGLTEIVSQTYGASLDEEARRLLAMLREESRRMGDMVDALARYCRAAADPMRKVPLDMTALARRAVVQETQRFSVDAAGISVAELPPAAGDPEWVAELWSELIANAVKFSSKRDPLAIAVAGRNDGNEPIYSIKDEGAGFNSRQVSQIFTLYRQFHRREEFPGVGAGLAIAYQIVTRHGGRVRVDSRAGVGTVVEFSLGVP